MMQAVAESGAGLRGASALHMNIFGLNPVVVFGTRRAEAPHAAAADRGEDKACFAVTEPNAGLDTTHLKTRAKREGDLYVVIGQKVWISTAQVADQMLLLARTHAARRGREAHQRPDVCSTPSSTGARSRSARSTRWAARRSTPTSFSSTASGCRSRIGSARKGEGFELHPARHQPRAHPAGRGGGRSRPRGAYSARQTTRRSASCSAGRSARTRRSSIRWRAMLDGSRGRQSDGVPRRHALRRRQALRRGSERREISRAPRPRSRPARPRCSRTAAWATPRNSTSSAIFANR